MKRVTQSLSIFVNRNTGWLIATAIVFFGLTNLAFLKDNERIVSNIQATTKNTETIVLKQDQTLEAIADLASDNQLSGEQLREILLCMLIVPIEQRTYDVANECREKATGTADSENSTSANSSTRQEQGSSAKPKPKPQEPSPEPDPDPEEPEDDHLLGCILVICI